jgi:ADP-heptose:LPS heptosyltransferase
VKVYDWEELQAQVAARKPLRKDTDLNGKILFVRHTWGIGDILYSTPALKALKDKFPKSEIHYVCSNPEVLFHNPAVDFVHHFLEFDDLFQIGENLKGKEWYWLDYDVPLKGGFDYKIHLRTKPIMNENLLRILSSNPKDLNEDERRFMDQASSSVISRYNMVALDMYCWHAFVDPPEKSVYYYPTPDELDFAKTLLQPIRDSGKRPFVLLPRTSTPMKDYPHWKKVVQMSPRDIVWIVLDAFQENRYKWSSLPNVIDYSAALRLRNSMAVCIEADFMASSDTGALYPRAARGGKCVVVYGPHEPEPFLKYFPSAKGLRIDKLRHTPGMVGFCSVGCYIDTQACKKSGEPNPCLLELDPEAVLQNIVEWSRE